MDLEPECRGCGTDRLYYRDTTNHTYYCRECHSVSTKPEKKIEPAELFESYEAAVAASETALVQAKKIEPTVIGVSSIETAEAATWASQAGRAIASTRRELEKQRDQIAKPLHAAWKKAREGYDAPLKLLGRLEKHLADGLLQYNALQAQAQAKALAEIAPTAEPAEIARTIEATNADVDGASRRQRWIARGSDGQPLPNTPAEAAARCLQIPAQFWILDHARLHAMARAQKSELAITGVEAVDEGSIIFK